MEISIEQSHATIQKDVLPEIDADPLQMRQLFQNLISNAIKFRKSKQTPIIQIKKRQLNPSTISISIKDNGIGFDEKYVDRIFNIFQRLHTSHEYSGSGVGLAVCRKIVERHRGTIDVKSVVGKGSTFIITMPIEQKEVNVNG